MPVRNQNHTVTPKLPASRPCRGWQLACSYHPNRAVKVYESSGFSLHYIQCILVGELCKFVSQRNSYQLNSYHQHSTAVFHIVEQWMSEAIPGLYQGHRLRVLIGSPRSYVCRIRIVKLRGLLEVTRCVAASSYNFNSSVALRVAVRPSERVCSITSGPGFDSTSPHKRHLPTNAQSCIIHEHVRRHRTITRRAPVAIFDRTV